jgi:hypothetical protein
MAALGITPHTPSQELEIVISNILSGGPGMIPANDYLLHFIETEAAWGGALGLFDCTNIQIRYFAANIVYTKVKKHWVQLNEAQQQEIFVYLLEYITQASVNAGDNKIFLDRVLLCLSCVCCRSNGGVSSFVNTALDKINTTPMDYSQILSGLNMLCVLPSEAELLDVGRTLRVNLQSELLQSGTAVLSKINEIANHNSLWETDRVFHMLVVKALRSWVPPMGLTLTSLAAGYAISMNMVCATLSSSNGPCIKEGCLFLRDVCAIADNDNDINQVPGKQEIRNNAVVSIVNSLTSNAAVLSPFFNSELDGGDSDVAYEICNALVSLAVNEAELLSNINSCPVEFFQLLLSCSNQRPRKVAGLTFDVWIALQDIPVVERHPYVSQDVFNTLLSNLLLQCEYPSDYDSNTGWDNCDDDEDDFEEFRDQKYGIQDVIVVCCYAIQGDSFYEILQKGFAESTEVSVDNGEIRVTNWRRLESTLYVFYHAMEAVKSSANSEKCFTALQLLHSVANLVLSAEVQEQCRQHNELQNTVCLFLGSLTFALTSAGKKDMDPSRPGYAQKMQISKLFLSSLNFLFVCLPTLKCCSSAAKAINKLCIQDGQKMLTVSSQPPQPNDMFIFTLQATIMNIIEGSLNTTEGKISEEIEAALLLVIEGIIRTLSTLPSLAITEKLNDLATLLERILGTELDCPKGDVSIARVELVLSYVGQIVRFSEPTVDENGGHVLRGFLTLLWPRLQQLETIYANQAPMLIKLFELYGRCLISAESVIISEVPNLSSSIVRAFHVQGGASSAALQCATVIVDLLARKQNPEMDAFLSTLLLHNVQVLIGYVEAVNSGSIKPVEDTIFGYYPDTIEKFFRFIYQYCVSCSIIIAESPALPQLCQLLVACFVACNESGPLREILKVVQFMFYPSRTRVDPTVHTKLLTASAVNGQAIVGHLMTVVSGSGSVAAALWTNVIDTLHCVLSGCCMSTQMIDECKTWLKVALRDIPAFNKIGDARKGSVFEQLFALCNYNDNGVNDSKLIQKRKDFKELLLKLCKVCVDQLEADCLDVNTSIHVYEL